MFGRVRASSSSLECLDAERSPSKIMNSHPLSIYEVTLMKMREGARLYAATSKPIEESVRGTVSFCKPEDSVEDAMDVDDGCNPTGSNSTDADSGRKPSKIVTISELFSRYEAKHSSKVSELDPIQTPPAQDETFKVHVPVVSKMVLS